MAMAALVSRKVKIAKRKRYTRTLAQHSTRRAPSHFFFICLFVYFILLLSFFLFSNQNQTFLHFCRQLMV